jgi:RNA methyltransferase, TrmH family
MKEQISSLQNPLVKRIVRLQQKGAARNEQNLFVVEGLREVTLALQSGVRPVNLLVCKDLFRPDKNYDPEIHKYDQQLLEVTHEVYEKIAYRGKSEGIIMVAQKYATQLDLITLSSNPLIIILEAVEKPGNLGAILRTADAAAADAVIICDPLCDVFNPNVVRSSLGCLFTNQVAVASNGEVLDWLMLHKIEIGVASLQTDQLYHQADLTKPLALAFGTEAHGLSAIWYQNANMRLKIPMLGKIDSMNVSASVAVLVYEAQRQRDFKLS